MLLMLRGWDRGEIFEGQSPLGGSSPSSTGGLGEYSTLSSVEVLDPMNEGRS